MAEFEPFGTVSPEDGGDRPVVWSAYIHDCGSMILVGNAAGDLGDTEMGVCHECPEVGPFRRVYVRAADA